MRDDPLDAPIPDEFQPSDYHQKCLSKIEAELAEVEALSIEECTARANEEYENEAKRLRDRISETVSLKEKYVRMLSEVNAWIPPSEDHKGLKLFMIEQIESSIKFDCGTESMEGDLQQLQRPTGQQWKDAKIASLVHTRAYHQKEHMEEVSRVTGRNVWIKQLRESLKS